MLSRVSGADDPHDGMPAHSPVSGGASHCGSDAGPWRLAERVPAISPTIETGSRRDTLRTLLIAVSSPYWRGAYVRRPERRVAQRAAYATSRPGDERLARRVTGLRRVSKLPPRTTFDTLD